MSAVIEVSRSSTDESPTAPFSRISGRNFRFHVRRVMAASNFYRDNLQLKPTYRDCECWVNDSHTAGFAISPQNELLNVFSRTKGQGNRLITFALARYPNLYLNCFAGGYLERFYSSHGFEVARRVPNWTPGAPDVVFMRRGNVNIPE